jgi:hypothetical protein
MKSTPTRRGLILPALMIISSILLIFMGCKKTPLPTAAAKGYLIKGKDGECLPTIVHGTFYNGIPAETDSNYIDVDVYVSSPGTYDINTYHRNGVQFRATGTFPDTGQKVVRLKAIGTFLAPAEISYPLVFDSSVCQLGIQIHDSLGRSMGNNTWEFTVAGQTYHGSCSAPVYQLPQYVGYSFEFQGYLASGAQDTVLQMDAFFPFESNGRPDTVDYPTNISPAQTWGFFSSPNGYNPIYYAGDNTPGALIKIHFNGDVGGVITGTFNGTALSVADQKIVNITNSRFKLVN